MSAQETFWADMTICCLKVTLPSAIVLHTQQNQCWLVVLWTTPSGAMHATLLSCNTLVEPYLGYIWV
jgi:hypothetical protein